MLRQSQTVHNLIHHPFETERPRRILFIQSMEDKNPASIFEGRTTGKRKALSLPGGGVEALLLVAGVKKCGIRFFDLDRLGYQIVSVHDRVRSRRLEGATYAERETRFQQMMLDYPADMNYEFRLDGFHKGEAVSLRATLIGEESLEKAAEREGLAETGHKITAVPFRDTLYVDRREKINHRTQQVENVVYTFTAEITSAYTVAIEEADEVAGRVWLNLYDSLPLQLARLRDKRPEYSELPFYSHIQKIVEIFRNKKIIDSITIAVRQEMASDHPMKNVSYGKEFLLVDWDRDQGALLQESSLIHPSWLLVFRPKNGEELKRESELFARNGSKEMPKRWRHRSAREWEWIMTALRDREESYWTSEQCEEELVRFRRELAKDEIETMESQSKITVAMPKGGVAMMQETVVVDPKPELVSEEEKTNWREEGADEEDIRLMLEHRAARAKEAAV